MLNKLTEISLLKEKFINERRDVLTSDISAAQKKLYKKLFDRLIDALETEEGKILNNKKNVSITATVDKIFKEFEIDLSNLMKGVTGDYNSILGYHQKYFSEFNSSLFATVKKEVTNAMYARVGLNATGIEKDGFIDSFIKDKTLARTVKQTVLSAVLNGTKLTDLTKSLNETITGTPERSGIIQNHFNTYIYDTYSQFDRETGNQFAVQLDLNYAAYAGGLVDASRDFCIVRNGKAFTREEIQAFGTPKDKFGGYTNKSKGEFAGKWSKGQGIVYVPERDLGCNRCGHTLNWCTYQIAKSMRSDISKSKYDKK